MTISPSRTISKLVLAPDEIFEISQEISRKYSPIISTKAFSLAKTISLTPNELFEISEEITRKHSPKLNANTPKVILLPIDPTHVYLSWNLGRSKPIPAIKAENLVLRIYPKKIETVNLTDSKDWFDVAINPTQTRLTLHVPKENDANSYRAEIGHVNNEEIFTPLATSNFVNIPNVKKHFYLNKNVVNLPGSYQYETSPTTQEN